MISLRPQSTKILSKFVSRSTSERISQVMQVHMSALLLLLQENHAECFSSNSGNNIHILSISMLLYQEQRSNPEIFLSVGFH